MALKRWWQYILLAIVVSVFSVLALVAIAAAFIYPALPSLEALTDYHPKLPLQVYSEDGFLIGEFGEERRAYVKIEQVPQVMKDAVLAIEDRRFYSHNGIDTTGVIRAIKNNLTGVSREGASTITMQVAKNFFTPPNGKRGLITKINEALLAIKIERNLSKDKILELYLNQIYLGQRAYGFAAASQVYFDKPLEKLTLAEAALLAGLPKAPSGYNPFINPKRSIGRQHEVLRDMLRFGFLKDEAYQEALKQPLTFKTAAQQQAVHALSADYVAEIVRDTLYAKYQDEIYSSGLKVYTTIRKSNQEAANAAVREGIIEYDIRHGYRGPEALIDVDALPSSDTKNALDVVLDDYEIYSDMVPAIITNLTAKSVQAHTKFGDDIDISGKGLSFVEKQLREKDPEKNKLKVGAVIRVLKTKGEKDTSTWRIVQLPQVESALIALDPDNGAVRALVGGFDFNRSKFNHVTQANRQPGSSLKPFIYSAALEKGYTPASLIEDKEITFSASQTGDNAWTPKNYHDGFAGPMRLRKALATSVNTVAIQVLDDIGAQYAQSYITRFGFPAKKHPPYLTLALGAGSATPWEMAQAYAVFANGGYRVRPNIISKIIDSDGKVIMTTKFDQAGKNAPRVIDARNAFIMNSMMQSVIQNGTATKALSLNRRDIAGKTGTTNDHHDAWFTGYSPNQVAIAWVGYDQPRPLGKGETGGVAALPIWIKYMGSALKGLPEKTLRVPEGVDTYNIDPVTGSRGGSLLEYFYHENPPPYFVPQDTADEYGYVNEDGIYVESPSTPEAPTPQDQAQQVLQPEIILSPATPPAEVKPVRTVPTTPPNVTVTPQNNPTAHNKPKEEITDPHEAATKMLGGQ
ncbi:MAG TPA: PBP1A family penicillin-binding protein [Methylotenera sp.]|nr:PBP1A family penicillin-binding protein [Methylotenera sp.]HPH05448.1 PBP1A family penicillin-binding protein [Methylotenera sp.]HPN02143.1 PBP1A family penicillin-binding protein [Methylotenera sp.]